jgi:hypothetical protein
MVLALNHLAIGPARHFRTLIAAVPSMFFVCAASSLKLQSPNEAEGVEDAGSVFTEYLQTNQAAQYAASREAY